MVYLTNNERLRLMKPLKKTILAYQMIEEGDRVAIGLSGGKDSSTLLYLLTALQKQLHFPFTIIPITLTLGFEGMDLTPMKEFVSRLGHDLHVRETNIGQIVFDIRQEKNPCSLCANLRRGTLYEYAASLGCNKVALGHHLDDGLETFFMNFLFNGKIGTFQPKTYLDRTNITIIRPLIGIEEEKIIKFVQAKNIPILHNPCPVNKKTKREEMKELIKKLSMDYPDIRQKFLHGASHVDINDFWNCNGGQS
jgi:tRNA 2-thiocytidine biosynthesis protein TtcA